MVINNIAFNLFGLNIYWYGISYSIGFLFSYLFVTYFAKDFGIKKKDIENIFISVIISSIFFGRLFHIIFYEPNYYLSNISEIIRFDHGGMSIHGGIFGSYLAIKYHSRKLNYNLLNLTDLFSLSSGFGLALGRLANFVNQELIGKITSNELIGVKFTKYDNNYRYPTTLFESIKNILVFQILLFEFLIKKIHLRPGLLTAWFLILYNSLRFLIDFLRLPENDLGLISMGQLLCLIYFIIGIILLYKIRK